MENKDRRRPEAGLTLEDIRAELVSLTGFYKQTQLSIETWLRLSTAAKIFDTIINSYRLEVEYLTGNAFNERLEKFIGPGGNPICSFDDINEQDK